MTKIPNKLYFRIGEVAEIAQVEPFVLRYWQRQFKQLKPHKNNKGQRRYSRSDVEMVLHIARLRYKEKYTIEGIKKLLQEEETRRSISQRVASHHDKLHHLCIQLRKEAEEMLNILKK